MPELLHCLKNGLLRCTTGIMFLPCLSCLFSHLLSVQIYISFASREYWQGDHLSGKPGNVREFDSCQGNVRDFTKVIEMSEKNLAREKLSKTVYCKLHICVHTGITVWTVVQTVLVASFNSYGDRQISTPHEINTPEPIDKKIGTSVRGPPIPNLVEIHSLGASGQIGEI